MMASETVQALQPPSGNQRSTVAAKRPQQGTTEVVKVSTAQTERQELPPAGQNQPESAAIQARQDLNQALKEIRGYSQSLNRNLEFTVDDTTGRTVIKVIDADSKEMIRQIPPEKMLALARRMRDHLESGLFFEDNA